MCYIESFFVNNLIEGDNFLVLCGFEIKQFFSCINIIKNIFKYFNIVKFVYLSNEQWVMFV